jgi:hypothetical protein
MNDSPDKRKDIADATRLYPRHRAAAAASLERIFASTIRP